MKRALTLLGVAMYLIVFSPLLLAGAIAHLVFLALGAGWVTADVGTDVFIKKLALL